jgi:hypothetical protein
MKVVLIAAFSLALLAAGGASFWVVSHSGDESVRAQGQAVQPGTKDRGVDGAEIAALRDQVEQLERLVIGLKAEVTMLGDERMRTPVGASDTAEAVETALAADAQFSAVQRQAVVAVIEAERQRLEDEREQARLDREQQRILDRAARVAQELGLGPADEKRLGDLLIESTLKRSELFARLREGGGWGPETRGVMRENMTALQESYEVSLITAFGQPLGEQIAEKTEIDGGGRGGFRGPGGGGSPGGEGGNNNRRRGGQ